MRYQTGTSLSATRTTLLRFYSSVNTNIKIKALLLLVIFFCIVAIAGTKVTSQDEEIIVQKKYPNEPVELVSIKTEKNQIPLGQPICQIGRMVQRLEV